MAQGRGRQPRQGAEVVASNVADAAGEEPEAEGRIRHPEDGLGMEEEPDWHVAMENGTLATVPLDAQGNSYVLDADGVTIRELWDSLNLAQLREVSAFRHRLPQACALAACRWPFWSICAKTFACGVRQELSRHNHAQHGVEVVQSWQHK